MKVTAIRGAAHFLPAIRTEKGQEEGLTI